MKSKLILIASLLILFGCTKMGVDTGKDKSPITIQKSETPSFTVSFEGGGTAIFYVADDEGYDYFVELSDSVEWGNGFYYKIIQSNEIEIYSSTGEYLETLESPISTSPSGYPGDCNKLGPRQSGEGYTACVERNFMNFCCDFVGCAVFATNPGLVLAASGLSCISLSSHHPYDYINAIFDHEQNVYIYEN